jgi:hypothetical protein
MNNKRQESLLYDIRKGLESVTSRIVVELAFDMSADQQFNGELNTIWHDIDRVLGRVYKMQNEMEEDKRGMGDDDSR